MSKFPLLLLAFIIVGNASAAPMLCKGKHHIVTVSSNGKRAQVYDLANEPVMFGSLLCNNAFIPLGRPEGKPLLKCSTIQPVADAGLSLYVYQPHDTQKYVGRLSTQSIIGPRVIDTLKCVKSLND